MPEYKIESFKTVGEKVEEVEAWLNEKAREGWRLVAATPGQGQWVIYHFERAPLLGLVEA